MPFYEYEYTNSRGQKHRVERLFKMSDAPQTVEVDDEGHIFTASRVISLPANMAKTWAGGNHSSLPDENSSFIPHGVMKGDLE